MDAVSVLFVQLRETFKFGACSQCGNPRDRADRRMCLDCRTYRAAHQTPWAEMTPEQRRRHQARVTANVYLRRGRLVRRPCEDCGEARAQMHHEDYSRPLGVTWLCLDCHTERHKQRRA